MSEQLNECYRNNNLNPPEWRADSFVTQFIISFLLS
jgi:hypothetical protein